MAQTYLPGVTFPRTVTKPNIEVEYIRSDKRILEQQGNHFKIYDDWGGTISLDLWHFLYSVIRPEYLAAGQYPVHAACAGKENYALLVGHSGSGKSTVLLNLISEFGWSAFSGNKTVISFNSDGMTAVAGTRSMSLVTADFGRFDKLTVRRQDYQNRTTTTLDDALYATVEKVPITIIFIVRLNDGIRETAELTNPSNLHTLYPYFMDVVNADTIMCEGVSVYCPSPPAGCQLMLAESLKKTLSGIKVVKVSGSLEFITKAIVNG